MPVCRCLCFCVHVHVGVCVSALEHAHTTHKHHLSSPLPCKLCLSEDFYFLFKLMLSVTACIFSRTLYLLVGTRKQSGKRGDRRERSREGNHALKMKGREKNRIETLREILNNKCRKQDTLHNYKLYENLISPTSLI